MKKLSDSKNSISGLFSLLIFGIFAVCITAVLIMGINTYQKLSDRDQASYSQRTCAHYLSAKIRQASSPEAMDIVSFGDGDALILPENYDGEKYLTYIYCSGGWLREYFTLEDAAGDPDMGEKVLPAGFLNISRDGDLLSITVTGEDGEETDLALFIRSGKEALQ